MISCDGIIISLNDSQCEQLTFSQLSQTGVVSFPLASLCEAEVGRTTATVRQTGKSEHLSSPCNSALWHLGNRTAVVRKKRRVEISFSRVLRRGYLFHRNQVGAGDDQFGQVSDPVFLFSLELVPFLEQLGELLLLSHRGLCD